jgi:membrane fusion protein (multidrug efflux system)
MDRDLSSDASSPSANAGSTRARRLAMAAPFVLAAIAAAVLLPGRLHAQAGLARRTHDDAVPTVAVVRPALDAATREIVLPASVQAWADTPIYARTNGYVKRWLVDIGTPVKAGQLLAEIETPEVDAALRQAEAAELRSRADADLAQLAAGRWTELARTDAVARQDVDQKQAEARAAAAVLAGMQADTARLRKLASFQRVVAPFDGVITARSTQVGALIDSGSGAAAAALFHLASTGRLRVGVDVPESDAASAVVGTTATVESPDQPGQALAGTISRRSEAIDPVGRTLHVEVDVPDPGDRLLAGSFAQVRLSLHDAHPGLSLPVTTLMFRPDGATVAVVRPDATIALVKVRLGRNDGRRVQILEGVSTGMAVVQNPSDSILAGEAVRVAAPAAGA